jgi:hypothetical protein
MDHRYILTQFLQTNREIILVVVGFKLRKRSFEMKLAILDLGEYRLDDSPPFSHHADRLSKRLLATPDIIQLVRYIGGVVPALLHRGPLLGIGELFLKQGDCFLGAAFEVLDDLVEVTLQSLGDDDVLPGAFEAAAQQLQVCLLARQPDRLIQARANQQYCHGDNGAGHEPLSYGQGNEMRRYPGEIVTECLLRKHCGHGQKG